LVTDFLEQRISPIFEVQAVNFFWPLLTFEDGTDILSRNVRNLLPTYASQHPTRARISTIPCRNLKPGVNLTVSRSIAPIFFFFVSTEKVSLRVKMKKKKARDRVKTGINWLCRFLYVQRLAKGSFGIKQAQLSATVWMNCRLSCLV